MSTPEIERIVEEFNNRSNDKMFLESECKNSFWFEEGEDIRYDQDEAGDWLRKSFTTLLTTHDAELQEKIERLEAFSYDEKNMSTEETNAYNQALIDLIKAIKK